MRWQATALQNIFQARSIAIAGASSDPVCLGRQILDNLVASGYSGKVYSVNPRVAEIRGLPCYSSVRDVPGPLDLVVVAVPLRAVLPVVDDSIAAGVGGLVVVTSGFREVGGEGAKIEERLALKVREAGIPMLGPNCMGFFNTAPDVRIDVTFSPAKPKAGPLAFLSQSGALAVAVLSLAEAAGIGFSIFASLGNEATLTHRELLEYAASDPQTRVIALYLESFNEAEAFLKTAREVTRHKPVVCLKGGRTEVGARAARSHTGALATGVRVLEAVMKQSGVILVDTTEEMLDVANALARAPRAAGKRVRILTNAGGPGVLATDHVVRRGLELPALGDAAQTALRAFVPSQAATGNPVDLTAAGTAPMYAQASRVLLDDPETDALLAVLVAPPGLSAGAVRAEFQKAAASSSKPVVAAFVAQPELLRQPATERLATVAYPESAAAVLAALVRRPRQEPPAITRKTAHLRIAPDLEQSFRLLKKYGIPVVRYAFARRIPKRASFPLAMKLVSPEIIHKTEAGAVTLNIQNMRELRAAWPKRKVRGVLLQGAKLGVHYHVGTVRGYTMRGHWRYLEHDWIAKAGTFIYEPAGEAHTLVITDDSPEPALILFVVEGGLVYLDKAANGSFAAYEDGFTFLELSRKYYREAGLDVRQLDLLVR